MSRPDKFYEIMAQRVMTMMRAIMEIVIAANHDDDAPRRVVRYMVLLSNEFLV